MIAFKNLEEILETTIKWEQALKDFYDVAEIALKDRESKRVVTLLKEKLLENLSVLQNIDISKFGRTEWIRYASDYRKDELIPLELSRGSPPRKLLEKILEYEEKLKSFYQTISVKLIARDQKELFESLATYKEEQMLAVRRLLEDYDLVT
jgi:NADH:ubiquinone oxidoreductase subunit C